MIENYHLNLSLSAKIFYQAQLRESQSLVSSYSMYLLDLYSPVKHSRHQHSRQVLSPGQHSRQVFEGNHFGLFFEKLLISLKLLILSYLPQSQIKNEYLRLIMHKKFIVNVKLNYEKIHKYLVFQVFTQVSTVVRKGKSLYPGQHSRQVLEGFHVTTVLHRTV